MRHPVQRTTKKILVWNAEKALPTLNIEKEIIYQRERTYFHFANF